MTPASPAQISIRDRIETAREKFTARYKIEPQQLFLGYRTGQQLSREISAAQGGMKVRLQNDDLYGTMKIRIKQEPDLLSLRVFMVQDG